MPGLYNQDTRNGTRIITPNQHIVLEIGTKRKGSEIPYTYSRKIGWKTAISELFWYLSGASNYSSIRDFGLEAIWSPWFRTTPPDKHQALYPRFWRNFNGVDQITTLIQNIQKAPSSTRHLVTCWDPSTLEDTELPPCHVMFGVNCNVEKKELHGSLVQRSVDLPIGAPFNVIAYTTLMHLIAHQTGYRAVKLGWTMMNCHVYANQRETLGKFQHQGYITPAKAYLKIKKAIDLTNNDYAYWVEQRRLLLAEENIQVLLTKEPKPYFQIPVSL